MARKEQWTAGGRLFPQAMKYPHLLLFTLAPAAAAAFALCAFTAVIGGFLEASALNPAAAAAEYALRAAACAVLCAVSLAAGKFSAGLLAARLERDFFLYCGGQIAAKDFLFYFGRGGAGRVPEIREGAARAGNAMVSGFLVLVQTFAACLACALAAGRIHLLLAPLPALFSVWVFCSLKSFYRKNEAAFLEEEEKREKLAADEKEAAAGRETFIVQALNKDAERRFAADAVFLRDAGLQSKKAAAAYAPDFFFWIFWGTALAAAFILRNRGAVSPGGLAAFAGCLPVFLYAVRRCPPAYTAMRQAGAAVGKILEFIEKPDTKKTAALSGNTAAGEKHLFAADQTVPAGGVIFDNVFFSYAAAIVLRRLSFSLAPGSFTVITGSAGSGKTTLARLIAGVLQPDMGRVSIGGENARAVFIEKEPFLFPLSVRENIALGYPSSSDADIRAAAEKAEAHEFISRLPQGYDTRAGEGGARLDASEILRITLARAILGNPEVLVVDDSAAAGDSETDSKLNKALAAAARGRTVCVVSHKLSRISQADYILFMKDGEILCQGSHEKLTLESADYRRIFSGL